jgi:hypothetical protein
MWRLLDMMFMPISIEPLNRIFKKRCLPQLVRRPESRREFHPEISLLNTHFADLELFEHQKNKQ